jgi:S1-C subfamily serine protease
MTARLSPWLAVLVLALCPAPTWAASDDETEELYEKAIKAAVKKIAPCVVQIETSGGAEIIAPGARGQPQIRKGVGPTSGVIVSADGYIVSSAFNFANKPTAIFVAIQGQPKRYVAKVVATDQTRMITLLKIDDVSGLPLPSPVPAKDIQIGRTAIAVGRTLAGDVEQSPSVSVGILSAVERIWGKAFQTDSKVSPVNYGGPLIDLAGRVYGIMVPASPQAEGETAGVGWYDSGIGFAIPLTDIEPILPRLKLGKDLKAGLLGVTMQSQDQYAEVPTIGTVAPGSAAEKVGMKTGDKILEVEGKKVNNHAQLRHQLGKRYEGDTVSVKVKRGEETVEFKPVLAGASSGSGVGFLGILPMRDDNKEGVEVRYVYAKSPAETAGIKVGDRIVKAGTAAAGPRPGPGPIPIPVPPGLQPVKDRDALLKILEAGVPGTELKLEVVRKEGGKVETLTAKLGEVPEGVPEKLPAEATKYKGQKPVAKEITEEGYVLTKKQSAAGDHSYYIYAPKKVDPNVTYSLVLWLHPVNKGKEKDIESLTDAWDSFCDKHHTILVCPLTEAAPGWQAGDKDFVLEALKAVENSYHIDKRRVVAHGMGVGGQMAFYLGFQARADIRAVATTGAALTNNPKERVANQPLTFFIAAGSKDPLAAAIKATKEKLVEFKYPAVYREIENLGHQYLTVDAFEELQRWLDSLDRM